MKISEQQIEEWTENPVTRELLELVEKQLDIIDGTPVSEAYERGNPQTTQENLAALTAMKFDYIDFADFLTGNWEVLLEGEDE